MSEHLLAFDTSTEVMTVALQAHGALFTWSGPGGAVASAQLVPRIRELLGRADIGLGDLQAVAFGRGPGAFTGLRTATAVAQGLAFGASLPVLALDSLLIVAEAARAAMLDGHHNSPALDVQVAMDARLEEVYAGSYRYSDGRWSTLAPPALFSAETLNAVWSGARPCIVVGSALSVLGDRLRCGAARRLRPCGDRAAALMRLAQQAWSEGRLLSDAAQALPLYLRDKVASTMAERALQQRIGSAA